MILIVDNYDSFTYNLYQYVADFTDDIVVKRNDAISVDDIKQLDPQAIIISPGPSRPENAGVCVELIQKLSGTIPILGVCLGHQAIAQAFGGQVIKANTCMHGKASQIFHHRSALYRNLPLPFLAGRYHSLIVDRASLPDVLHVEAETADEIVMGIKHNSHPTYGVQFHPESLLSDHGNKIIENFLVLSHEGVTPC